MYGLHRIHTPLFWAVVDRWKSQHENVHDGSAGASTTVNGDLRDDESTAATNDSRRTDGDDATGDQTSQMATTDTAGTRAKGRSRTSVLNSTTRVSTIRRSLKTTASTSSSGTNSRRWDSATHRRKVGASSLTVPGKGSLYALKHEFKSENDSTRGSCSNGAGTSKRTNRKPITNYSRFSRVQQQQQQQQQRLKTQKSHVLSRRSNLALPTGSSSRSLTGSGSSSLPSSRIPTQSKFLTGVKATRTAPTTEQRSSHRNTKWSHMDYPQYFECRPDQGARSTSHSFSDLDHSGFRDLPKRLNSPCSPRNDASAVWDKHYSEVEAHSDAAGDSDYTQDDEEEEEHMDDAGPLSAVLPVTTYRIKGKKPHRLSSLGSRSVLQGPRRSMIQLGKSSVRSNRYGRSKTVQRQGAPIHRLGDGSASNTTSGNNKVLGTRSIPPSARSHQSYQSGKTPPIKAINRQSGRSTDAQDGTHGQYVPKDRLNAVSVTISLVGGTEKSMKYSNSGERWDSPLSTNKQKMVQSPPSVSKDPLGGGCSSGGSNSVGSGNADERLYCLCKTLSFGDMIACDNPYCEIEWFHFNCVDVHSQPRGKWYCPYCRGDTSKTKRPDAQCRMDVAFFN